MLKQPGLLSIRGVRQKMSLKNCPAGPKLASLQSRWKLRTLRSSGSTRLPKPANLQTLSLTNSPGCRFRPSKAPHDSEELRPTDALDGLQRRSGGFERILCESVSNNRSSSTGRDGATLVSTNQNETIPELPRQEVHACEAFSRYRSMMSRDSAMLVGWPHLKRKASHTASAHAFA